MKNIKLKPCKGCGAKTTETYPARIGMQRRAKIVPFCLNCQAQSRVGR
jgi:RNase P subunit RPR2